MKTDTPPSKVSNASLNVLALLGVFTACVYAASFILQLVLTFFLFFLLNPLVEWAETKKVSRKVSSPVVVIFVIVGFLAMGWLGLGASAKIAYEIPQYTGKIKKTLQTLQGKAEEIQKGTNSIIPTPSQKDDVQKVQVMEGINGDTSHKLIQGVGNAAEILAACFLVPILLLFLLLEKGSLHSALVKAVSPNFRLWMIGREMGDMTRGFFFGNMLVGLGTGLGFYILFSFLHLENRLILSLAAGFFNLIPMVGAILGALLPMGQAYLQFSTAGPALTVLGVSVFLHFFVANFVIPKIVGKSINVNATAATIGLIFWGWIWGPLGLLLAVPLTAMIRIFLAAHASTELWAKLIEEESEGHLTRMALPKLQTDSHIAPL